MDTVYDIRDMILRIQF